MTLSGYCLHIMTLPGKVEKKKKKKVSLEWPQTALYRESSVKLQKELPEKFLYQACEWTGMLLFFLNEKCWRKPNPEKRKEKKETF